MIIFYVINAFVHFDFLGDAATPAGIAVVHSIFNIAATIVLLPFAKVLEKLAYMSIKEDHAERRTAVQETEEELKKTGCPLPGTAGSGYQPLYGSYSLYGTHE